MAHWREECTKVLKAALVKATDGDEIREISSAIGSLQPWKPEKAAPLPVRVVPSTKRRKRKRRRAARSNG